MTFRASTFAIRDVTATERPYFSRTLVPLNDTGTHDETGVRMYRIGDRLYNHPVAQAQYALGLLNTYVATGDGRFLDRARLQAQRLIDTAVKSRGAWYFPYPFDHPRHGELMEAPWYSAMAQGQGLAVFVWLYELTGERRYLDAAGMTFNSFKNPRSSTAPWTVFVDSSGYLWFEEYAHAIPDRTFNGHLFALFGIYYYWQLTDDADALRLLKGGATTARLYLDRIRQPGWISLYCVTHGVRLSAYHLVHIYQMQRLYTLTAEIDFADDTENLFRDYPDYRITGTVTFAAGTHTAYRFDGSGRVTASKTVTLSRLSSAPSSSRRGVFGRSGVWFQISDGVFAGYLVQEQPGRVYIRGLLRHVIDYRPARPISLLAGSYTGYQFDSGGTVTASRMASYSADAALLVSRQGVINGRTYRLVAEGPLAGYWLATGGGSSRVFIPRLAGGDRYATAAAVSAWQFAPGVLVAYLATGEKFPDALAGAPAAAKTGGPVLLVGRDTLPVATAAELTRLRPGRLVVLGDASSVSDAVVSALGSYTSGSVTRISGRDRYATAAAISAATFAPGVPLVYVATGTNFPDALAGGAAAALAGVPVLLVGRDHLPSATANELARLKPGRVVVLGSSASVSEAVRTSLDAYTAGSVTRLAGRDRYATAVAISRARFAPDGPRYVFVATGTNFPDALAAAVVAGRRGGPLLLVGRDTLPSSVAAELSRLDPSTIVVLGGTPSVSQQVLVAMRARWP